MIICSRKTKLIGNTVQSLIRSNSYIISEISPVDYATIQQKLSIFQIGNKLMQIDIKKKPYSCIHWNRKVEKKCH